jgi:hypothetical protein
MPDREYDRPAYVTIILAMLLTVLGVLAVTHYAARFAPTPVKVAPPIKKEGISLNTTPATWLGEKAGSSIRTTGKELPATAC